VVVTAVIIECSFVVGEGGRGGGEIRETNQVSI
jgi:hypothetical protein